MHARLRSLCADALEAAGYRVQHARPPLALNALLSRPYHTHLHEVSMHVRVGSSTWGETLVLDCVKDCIPRQDPLWSSKAYTASLHTRTTIVPLLICPAQRATPAKAPKADKMMHKRRARRCMFVQQRCKPLAMLSHAPLQMLSIPSDGLLIMACKQASKPICKYYQQYIYLYM